jgi:hypothetical protein
VRIEPWNVPRYMICFRVAMLEPEHTKRGTTDACCDCGEDCQVTFSGMIAKLTRPYLVICTVCAKHREIEAGGSGEWTRVVEAKPR